MDLIAYTVGKTKIREFHRQAEIDRALREAERGRSSASGRGKPDLDGFSRMAHRLVRRLTRGPAEV